MHISYHLKFDSQDEDLHHRNGNKTAHQPLNRINDSSEEDNNELGDETISGENDVEYAEFSMSVRTSPKEQVQNRNGDGDGSGSASLNCAVNLNEFDDFMSLPISTPANVSSKEFFSIKIMMN